MSRQVIYRLIWVPSAIALLASLTFLAGRPIATAAPGPLTTYTASDKSMRVQYPGNWEVHQLGSSGVDSGVRFAGGAYTAIRFSTDLAGSLMADIDRSGSSGMLGMLPGGGLGGAAQRSPLEKLHERKGQELAQSKGFPDYTEGQTRVQQIAGTEARVTDFTYTEPSLVGAQPMVGIRATALLGDRRLLIMAYCPRPQEKEIVPVFDKMIASLVTQ